MRIKNFKKSEKESKGITLIALVITIIVLLILAGVSIATITGQNGLLTKTSIAKEETTKEQVLEELKIIITEAETDFFAKKERTPTLKELSEYLRDNRLDIDMTIIYQQKLAKVTIDETQIIDSNTGEVNYENIAHALIEYKNYEFILNKNLIIDENNIEKLGDITSAETYTIIYDANGGEGAPVDDTKYHKGDTVTVDLSTIPTRDGYEFLGWADSNNVDTPDYAIGKETTFVLGEENKTIYAVWGLKVAPCIADAFVRSDVTGAYEVGAKMLQVRRMGKYLYDGIKI